jgi:adenylate cyclase
LHARIELRRDKFVLVDQSTNGTYILPGDGEIVLMRRDEIVLPNKGIIALGQQDDTTSPMAIKFQII